MGSVPAVAVCRPVVAVSGNNLMVIGIDTCYDTVRRDQSVTGFVASLNNTCTCCYTCARFQQPGEALRVTEQSTDFADQ